MLTNVKNIEKIATRLRFDSFQHQNISRLKFRFTEQGLKYFLLNIREVIKYSCGSMVLSI